MRVIYNSRTPIKHDPLDDGISQVTLIDYMGDDLRVVNAARVSFDKESSWVEDPRNPDFPNVLSERDRKLIHYLARHNHWTPFSHCMVTLRIKMPIFVARQWFKHSVGFTRNEVSRRYVESTPEFYVPKAWRKRAENVKQGSSDEAHCESYQLSSDASALYNKILGQYSHMIEEGVCAEQARMILPQSMYTEFFETSSLAGYARLCKLRLDSNAQKETRLYAEAVSEIMARLFPVSWGALSHHTESK